MTIGIYRLVFKGTEKCYIGQSVNIERRYLEHVRGLEKGTGAKKLQAGFSLYGKPSLDILLDNIPSTELDDMEKEAIEIFNSVDNGFNTYIDAFEAPLLKGTDHGNAKFTREQILEVFALLVHTSKPYSEISSITSVTEGSISAISVGKNHSWLSEESPEEYRILLSKIGTRANYNSAEDKGYYSIISEKLSAKARGIVYPKIKSPSGEVFTIDNAYAFAKKHGLAGNHFQEVLNGHRKSHKGWKLNE